MITEMKEQQVGESALETKELSEDELDVFKMQSVTGYICPNKGDFSRDFPEPKRPALNKPLNFKSKSKAETFYQATES